MNLSNVCKIIIYYALNFASRLITYAIFPYDQYEMYNYL